MYNEDMRQPGMYKYLPKSKAALRLHDVACEIQWRVLARALGVSTASLSNWTRGRSLPNVESALVIQKVVGIPLEDWLEEAL